MMSIKEIVDEIGEENFIDHLIICEIEEIEHYSDEKYQEACSRVKNSPLALILGRRSVKSE